LSVLAVWLGSEHVATLEQTRRRELRLRYTDQAIDTYGLGSVALSVAMPVAPRLGGRPVEFWAESMLPEGETRTALEERFGVRRGDTFGLLEAIGADCAGAVSFLPQGPTPVQTVSPAQVLAEQDLVQAIDDLPNKPLGVDEDFRRNCCWYGCPTGAGPDPAAAPPARTSPSRTLSHIRVLSSRRHSLLLWLPAPVLPPASSSWSTTGASGRYWFLDALTVSSSGSQSQDSTRRTGALLSAWTRLAGRSTRAKKRTARLWPAWQRYSPGTELTGSRT
jgi:HipA-like protein